MVYVRGYGRDYVDTIALYDKNKNMANVLAKIDNYYESNNKTYKKPIATELVLKLSDIKEKDLCYKIDVRTISSPYNDFSYVNKKAKELAVKIQGANNV
jgi:hypothetical protein